MFRLNSLPPIDVAISFELKSFSDHNTIRQALSIDQSYLHNDAWTRARRELETQLGAEHGDWYNSHTIEAGVMSEYAQSLLGTLAMSQEADIFFSDNATNLLARAHGFIIEEPADDDIATAEQIAVTVLPEGYQFRSAQEHSLDGEAVPAYPPPGYHLVSAT